MTSSTTFRSPARIFAAVFVVSAILLLTSIVIVQAPHSPSSNLRSSSILTHHDWVGYKGNDTIYPTTDTQVFPLPLQHDFSYQTGANSSISCGSGGCGIANSNLLNVSSLSYEYPRYGDLGSSWANQFDIWVWAGATGGGTAFDVFPQGCNDAAQVFLPYAIDLAATPKGLPSGNTNLFAVGNNSGMNATAGTIGGDTGTGGTAELKTLIGLGLDFASLVFPPDIGVVLTLGSIGLDLSDFTGPDGPTSNSFVTSNPDVPGDQTATEVALATGGSISNGCQQVKGGQNVFSHAGLIEEQIPASGLSTVSSSASLTISSSTYIEFNDNSYDPAATQVSAGASSSLNYPIAPAVGIGGFVDLYPGGPSAGDPGVYGAVVTLQQSCGGTLTDFVISASESTGYWHFFADPACTYSYSVSLNGWWYDYPVSITRTGSISPSLTDQVGQDFENLNIGLWGGAVNFVESGLPSFTTFSVTLNGADENSGGGTTVSFLIANGTNYPFSVGPITDYSISPSSGTVTVQGAAVTKDITFTQTGSYTVTISETGLPGGDTWSAGVGSTEKTGSAGSTLTFTGLAGSNSWSASTVIVSESCSGNLCTIKEYVPSPATGTVNGATSIKVTYTYTIKTFRT